MGTISLKELLATMDKWSNAACLGYAIVAMKRLGMEEEEIKRIIGQIESEFGDMSVSEAEADYYDSVY
ncbi:MAG: hypothetical protein RSK76_01475 [Clostridia bacterium]